MKLWIAIFWMLSGVLLLIKQADAKSVLPAQWQHCREQPAPLVRLVCYDAIADVSAQSVLAALSEPHSAAWHDIQQQETQRSGDSPLFILGHKPDSDALLLTRPALRGATLAISCADVITRIWLRLDAPWPDTQVIAQTDDLPASSNWFVRDKGMLLEFGRGLPAIEELKHWAGQQVLTLQAKNKRMTVRVDLNGLADALRPLRQQCRW
ncbi:MAG: type VI secretion system-associated protein VasI [Plesiomonas sp.]|uniref:type VI secretion system-associated protein VasI n=1 Tax=Plesiomonas sp. TaxID=2486279 RepID=UPI003EE60230